MQEIKNLLKGVYLFKTLTDDEIEKISDIAEKLSFASGDTIFYEKADARSFYIVQHGSVKIYQKVKDDEQQVNSLGPGMHFGELPFLDQLKRSASVEATENATLIEVPYDKLDELLKNDQKMAADVYQAFAHFLAARLRKVTTDLSFARERNLKHF